MTQALNMNYPVQASRSSSLTKTRQRTPFEKDSMLAIFRIKKNDEVFNYDVNRYEYLIGTKMP
jgi:hypothetical protein